MNEILTIQNFGPIKHMAFDLKKINVLIGDQGTGKSTVAKMLLSLQNTVYRELFDLEYEGNKDEETQQFLKYLEIMGIENYIHEDSHISYSCDDYKFSFSESKVEVKKEGLDHLKISNYNFNYIPAERNLVVALANSLYALIETGSSLPRLLTRFGNKYLQSRNKNAEFDYLDTIGVKYSYSEGKSDKVTLKNGKEILLSDASTGVQMSMPLLLVLDDITKQRFAKNDAEYLRPNLLVVEEPELNLFPETQEKLFKYIINRVAVKDSRRLLYNNHLLITTHSPYILTSLNNLIQAYQVGVKFPGEVNTIIDKEYWVNPDDVSAYLLQPDGTCKNIMNKDERLIDAAEIDSVSRKLNKEFDDLLNIEFGIEA